MKYDFKFRGQKIIDLLIEFSYLAVIFIVPLYFSVLFPTYNIFELSKLFIFKILVYVLLFLTVLKIVFYRPKSFFVGHKFADSYLSFKKYYLIPLVFIFGLGITLFFSINPWQSFFGSYDRQAGYSSYLFYGLWLFLLVFNLKTIDNHRDDNCQKESLEIKINHIFAVASISGFLVAIYGILQRLGIDFLTWPEDPLFTRRAFSTFGQPNFLASWLLLVIPLSAYLIYKHKQFLIRFFYSLVLASEVICLFLTSSRGAIVALVFSLILFILYLIKFVKIEKKNKLTFGGIFIAFVILGSVIFSLNNPGRLSSLFDLKSGSSAARVNYYSAAVEAISRKPLFGYGLDNGAQVFIPYYQTDWGITANVGVSTDRAHNLILDILIGGGIFALILFSLLYFQFFRIALRNIFENKYRTQSLAIFFGGAAYLVSLLFNFSLVTAEIYFFLFLALLITINSKSEVELVLASGEKNNLSPINFFSFIISLFIFVLVGFGISYEFRILTADHYFQTLYINTTSKQYFTAFTLAEYLSEEKTNSINQNYYERVFADILSSDYEGVEDVLAKKLIQKKLSELNNKLLDNNYHNIFVKGKISYALGDNLAAEKYFKEVIALSPYWPEAYLKLGDVFVKEKNNKEAILNYQLILKILPDVNDSRLNAEHKKFLSLYTKSILLSLADLYFNEKNYLEAEKYYQSAYQMDFSDFTLFKKIADTYYLRGAISQTREYNLRGAKRSPKDYNWFLAIAVLYKEKGDKLNAHEYFQKALELAPQEELLLELKNKY